MAPSVLWAVSKSASSVSLRMLSPIQQAGQEASLGGVDDGTESLGEAGDEGTGGDFDVGVDASDGAAVGEVAGVAPLGGEGKEGRLHVCPGKASWPMQGPQREQHAQKKSKTKTKT